MQKSDNSLKNICIAAINRSTIPPFDFQYTKIYEEETLSDNTNIKVDVRFENDEECF
ncbi:hypothetical protein [Pinibacter soli]|uniref:hypothetical protein n=1 Tax=Pinibacter soli TaxID=3044211 RepID=UPI00249BDE82|nr:hypothetical protein [Pinibacter soli]